MDTAFYSWLLELARDAHRKGCSQRMVTASLSIWHSVWQSGTAPSVAAVADWATKSPRRFTLLRQTEPGLIERCLANEARRNPQPLPEVERNEEDSPAAGSEDQQVAA